MKFTSVLGAIFIALKLTNTITWSWWLVLLPIYWLPILFVILTFIYGFIKLAVEMVFVMNMLMEEVDVDEDEE